MPRAIELLLAVAVAVPALPATYSFHVVGEDPGGWPAVLSSVGLRSEAIVKADVIVVPNSAPAPELDWNAKLNQGTILIVEGDSPLAVSLGFRPTAQRVLTRNLEDLHAPKLPIIWEKALDLPVFETPPGAQIFAKERWQGAPLLAGFRHGAGAVLWSAVPPGVRGYERFPYLPQALTGLGLSPPFRGQGLWAFFDSSYRLRADVEYLAPRWRRAGISAIHVAAWHYWERNPKADEYLKTLIQACHQNAISVYAWFELPHVSQSFWDQHPEWREQTALMQDAQLDWRRLMNLADRDAFKAVSDGVRDLVNRFDWDGANLAELYFESLEGADNPARFTPMNQVVRAGFRQIAGFDPRDLFAPASPRAAANNPAGLKQFLEYRAELARRLQGEWIAQVEEIRKSKPYLDLVLTHVDDRFDGSMRDKLGADAAKVLPLLSQHDFTFLIEDPATLWNLGPERYPQIASRYAALTPHPEKLAVDINIVERYQDAYPTKQQTGAELFELVHLASLAFPRVAVYFENSLAPLDLALLSAAASTIERVQQSGLKLVVDSKRGVGVPWSGPAVVDGRPWPIGDDHTVWVPKGPHSIEAAPRAPVVRILDFNGTVKSATVGNSSVEIAYESSARALAQLERKPKRVELDGMEIDPEFEGSVLVLPRGQHIVVITPL